MGFQQELAEQELEAEFPPLQNSSVFAFKGLQHWLISPCPVWWSSGLLRLLSQCYIRKTETKENTMLSCYPLDYCLIKQLSQSLINFTIIACFSPSLKNKEHQLLQARNTRAQTLPGPNTTLCPHIQATFWSPSIIHCLSPDLLLWSSNSLWFYCICFTYFWPLNIQNIFYLWNWVSLCRSGWPQILNDTPASAFQLLGLQALVIIPGLRIFLFIF